MFVLNHFIKQVNRELRTPFILTTHDLTDLENLCENVTIINKETIVYNDGMSRLNRYFSAKDMNIRNIPIEEVMKGIYTS